MKKHLITVIVASLICSSSYAQKRTWDDERQEAQRYVYQAINLIKSNKLNDNEACRFYPQKVMPLLEKAAELENVKAMAMLGRAYHLQYERCGVKATGKGVKWLHQACLKGDFRSCEYIVNTRGAHLNY